MGKIIVIGLGPGDVDMLTLKAAEYLKNGNKVFLRTEKHPTVRYLKENNIKYETYDYVYEKEENFDEVYKYIAKDLVEKCKKYGIINYGVPGNPLVAEKTVSILIEIKKQGDIDLDIIPGMSFIDPVISSLRFDPIDGLKIIDGLSLGEQTVDINNHNIITQVYNTIIASDVKLKLSEIYGDDYEIYVIKSAGINNEEKIAKIPIYELDRLDWIDYLTSIYIPKVDKTNRKTYDMNNLISIMEKLRSKEGCPWDIKQTHQSLRQYVLEEAYEVVDAIDNEDIDGLIEELGDLLLQVIFHSQIGKEEGYFNIWNVTSNICQKLIYRHPHVFSDKIAENQEEAIISWNEMKAREKDVTSYYQKLMNLPKGISALMKSYKVQEIAADVGFDWENPKDAFTKVKEELQEVLDEYEKKDITSLEEELGDLLFAIVNVCRLSNINPEIALNITIKKFVERFRFMEEESIKEGRDLKDLTLCEMDKLWDKSKIHKNKKNDKK